MTLAGRLDLAAAPQLQRAILEQLAEQPPAIICDLDQVDAVDPRAPGHPPPSGILRWAGAP
jgi:anti-anti-sigma regulatory factor